MIRKILVPMDGSDNSMKALKMGLEMMSKFDAKLEILYVVNEDHIRDLVEAGYGDIGFAKEGLDMVKASAEAALKAAKTLVEEAKVEAEIECREGEPAEIILDEAAVKNADCIVMGSRGLSGLKQFLLGSVSNEVVNDAKIPVFVVK